MNQRAKVLSQLVQESLYVVDERAVAEAIILRSTVRRAVPDLPFRSVARESDADAGLATSAPSFHLGDVVGWRSMLH